MVEMCKSNPGRSSSRYPGAHARRSAPHGGSPMQPRPSFVSLAVLLASAGTRAQTTWYAICFGIAP
jgi:hypothetical protein